METQNLRDVKLLETIRTSVGSNARPLLLTGGAVVTMNPVIGDWKAADVLLFGSIIVGVGPGLLKAAQDDKSIVIDCRGTLVLPAALDFTSLKNTGSLTPGNQANVAVIRIKELTDNAFNKEMMSGNIDLLVIEGKVQVWNGQRLPQTDMEEIKTHELNNSADNASLQGMWVDEHDFVKQELLPDGRYDEARGDRKSAFQGKYWISGNRIDYLDDLGFWAFGEFTNGGLDHAGYRFHKQR